MKIAFCIFKYYPYGGMGRNFVRIIRACLARGHEVEIYAMIWQGEIDPDLKVTIVPNKGFTNATRCASYVKNLKPILDEKRYDVVVGFNRMPYLDVFYAADVCYEQDVLERHGWFYRLTPRYKIYSAFERAVFDPQAKTKIMIIADRQKKQFIHHYHTPEERFYLLPPGISKDRMAPGNAKELRKKYREEFELKDDEQLLLLIGSNYQLKGVDRAINALSTLPETMRKKTFLWIVGQGKKASFIRQAKRLKVNEQVKFLGLSDRIPDLLLAADLLIHPARREAAGMVLLEAIVAGLPVIATDVCGFAFHIEKAQAGIVIPSPFQQETLNNALRDSLNSANQSKWRKNALYYAKTQDLYERAEKAADIICGKES